MPLLRKAIVRTLIKGSLARRPQLFEFKFFDGDIDAGSEDD